MTPHREFFYLRNDYCYRENKKIGNFCRFFDEKKLNVAYVFFLNMLTQTNAVQPGNNGRKIEVFFALYISEGFEKNIYHIWVEKIGAKS